MHRVVANGNLLQVLRPPQGEGNEGKLYAVAISPDGATVAVGGWTGELGADSIYLFDRASGSLRRAIGGLPNVINHLCYSPDGRYLAAALGGANGIRVDRTGDGREVARDTDYKDHSYWAEFDHSGRLVTTSDDGFVRLYDSEFRLIAKRQAPGGNQPFSARFSPDSSKVAAGFNDSTAVNVLSSHDLSFVYAPDTSSVNKGEMSKVAWSADGRTLYAGGRYQDSSGLSPILSWSDGGRGSVRAWRAAANTVMDLRALPGGRLAFGAQDPRLGVLDSEGLILWQRAPEILDYRGDQEKLRLARDGSVVQFGFDTLSD